MAEPALSDLCSTCHTNVPVYRCPRCSTRTCSLPCFQKHQARAQCSGKRDPTKFVSKSQLETPAGIDHDFNFITKIEESLHAADKTNEEQNRRMKEHPVIPRKKPHLYAKAVWNAQVDIVRAPQGMSRQKQNDTRWTAKGLSWTVEWVHDSKETRLSQVMETLPMREAYAQLLAGQIWKDKNTSTNFDPADSRPKKRNKVKHDAKPNGDPGVPLDPSWRVLDEETIDGLVVRDAGSGRHEDSSSLVKVEPQAEGDLDSSDRDPGVAKQGIATEAKVIVIKEEDAEVEENPSEQEPIVGNHPDLADTSTKKEKDREDTEDTEDPSKQEADAKDPPSQPNPTDTSTKKEEDLDDLAESHNLSPAGTPDPSGLYYYLLKPRTSSTRRVLVPLSPSDSLSHCLRNRAVLEFPTIFALTTAPLNLLSATADLMLETDYVKQTKDEDDEFKKTLADAGMDLEKLDKADRDAMKMEVETTMGQEGLDKARLTEVLRRDVVGR
ncbi:hypothetical protein K402DRAFT_133274 [Aulographum hederae CBS 113979]|uniref:Box C/D snoRNA protein 1 n=1 Tax=Aulographum hederae CBS 113979 TaxID=1176131 RepID=A0A6G1GUP5_9PEZI|nr:hypothetical protein K402DRAFT_133274 [Aulographum hederae CBS 113979]